MMTIFVASAGGAALRSGWSSYQNWKVARGELPAPVRNFGFWTDRKLKLLDTLLWAGIIVPPICGAALFFSVYGLNIFGYEVIAGAYPVNAIGGR